MGYNHCASLLRGCEIEAETILTSHAIFGLLGTLAGMWVFVELLNVSSRNRRRMYLAGMASAVFIWLSFLSGGYWYVSFYATNRDIILAGPRPWAHLFYMEAKEHLFFLILLLVTYLPVILKDENLPTDKRSRSLALAVAGLIVLLGLVMERFGSIVSMGVTIGLRR